MKKIIKNNIFGFIVGTLLMSFIGVYAAIKMQASEIGYNDTTVEDALNSLKEKSGPVKRNPVTGGETYKGIVYLDPTNLEKTCNESNSVSTTETKTGCMK